MATNTTNYNLVKPAVGDYYDIAVPNGNMDIIDGKLKENADAIAGKQSAITGGATTITDSNLATLRALVSDAQGKVAVSTTTLDELAYLVGLTGNVQAQLNGKSGFDIAGTSDDIYGALLTDEGLKIQWRSQQMSANSGTITFPEAFANTNYVVLASIQATAGTNYMVLIRAKTNESIDVYTNWTSGGITRINAIAIGR